MKKLTLLLVSGLLFGVSVSSYAQQPAQTQSAQLPSVNSVNIPVPKYGDTPSKTVQTENERMEARQREQKVEDEQQNQQQMQERREQITQEQQRDERQRMILNQMQNMPGGGGFAKSNQPDQFTRQTGTMRLQ